MGTNKRYADSIDRRRGPDDLVFGNGLTPLFRPHTTSGWFTHAVRRSRAVDPTFPLLAIHDLRHTAASLAVESGAHIKVIQKMLGHASAAMTLGTYADLFDGDLDAVSDRMSDLRELTLRASVEALEETSVGVLWGLGSEMAPETAETLKSPGF